MLSFHMVPEIILLIDPAAVLYSVSIDLMMATSIKVETALVMQHKEGLIFIYFLSTCSTVHFNSRFVRAKTLAINNINGERFSIFGRLVISIQYFLINPCYDPIVKKSGNKMIQNAI